MLQRDKLKSQTRIKTIDRVLIILMWFHPKYIKWTFSNNKCLTIKVVLPSVTQIMIPKTNILATIIGQIMLKTNLGQGSVYSQPSHSLNQLKSWHSLRSPVRECNRAIET